MLLFEFPVIRSHIWLVFDVTSAMAICRHDDPFGQWCAPPANGQYSYRFSITHKKRDAWMISCSFLASLRYQVRLDSIL